MGNFSTGIQISNDNRESITRVIFQLDPNLLDAIARKFYDSHVETEKGIPSIQPNAKFYKCPKCGVIFNKEIFASYNLCQGQETNHPITITEPIDWHPPSSDAGFNTLLASVESALSSNLATGNYGETEATNVKGAKNKMEMERRLMSNAHKMSSFMINTLLGDIKRYMNPEIYEPPNSIANFFSYSFVYDFIMGMSRNIYAVLSKGVGMKGVQTVTENRIVTEERNQQDVGYSTRRQQENSQNDSWFRGLFNQEHNLR